jgi:hypothetical protein
MLLPCHFISLTRDVNENVNDHCSEGCGTPPTTPLTPLDELALKRHRFFTNLLEAANSAITNNQIRYDQLETFEFSMLSSAGVDAEKNDDYRQSCSSTSTMTTNSKFKLF